VLVLCNPLPGKTSLKLPSTCRVSTGRKTIHSFTLTSSVTYGGSTATRCLCLPSARPHTSPVLFAVGELIHLVGRQVRARAGGSCSGSRSTHGDVRSIAAGTARLAGLVEVSGCQTNTHTHRSDELSMSNK